ncbi:MAG: zeta toxin family protein [Pedobacter sp.]|jgi:predicted ABC-type ATPase|uniref:zeta toxin family protein n=1 Tax=Pedobacter sp. TaxID=1411316 RepID=UPI003565EB1B
MPILETLKKLYQLSEKDFVAIQQDIIDIYAYTVSAIRNPTVIILGGQPGAGKTELEKEARLELFDNVVTCNADLFRDFHPDASLIRSKHSEYYPEITSDYAQRWNRGLRDHCEKHKLNYILETTFSSGELMNETIESLKSMGYVVEIKLLAVHPKLSFLGTQLRYEHMIAIEGSGRAVSIAAHEERFVNIPNTLAMVQQAGLYDELCIYGRNVASGQNSLTHGIQVLERNPKNPLAVFRAEIEKEWPHKMVVYFEQILEELLDIKIQRKCGSEEIKDITASLERKIPLSWPETDKDISIEIKKVKGREYPERGTGLGL